MSETRESGVYDMPAVEYHADTGSLSQSGAKLLLPPSTPAHFRYQVDNPPTPKREYDFGHGAHKLVLGKGADIVVVEENDWRKKVAQEARDQAHAVGKIPLLAHEYERAEAMAAALRKHPLAAALFSNGEPERSLYWRDPVTGMTLRARLDWLPHKTGRRMIVPDYKTCDAADDEAVSRAIGSHGYHQQAAWYSDAVTALGLDDDPAFLLVMQEKKPPYLVNVVEPDVIALRIARSLNRRAIDTYAECLTNDHWPGYGDDIKLVNLPPYTENKYREEVLA